MPGWMGMLCLGLWAALVPGWSQDRVADHYERGVKLLEQGLWDPAIREFQVVLNLDPEQVETHIALGVALSNKHELEQALASFQKAVDLRPESAQARFNLGLALRNTERIEGAISELEEAIPARPGGCSQHASSSVFCCNRQACGSVPSSSSKRSWMRAPNRRRLTTGSASPTRSEGISRKRSPQFRRAIELDPQLVRTRNSLGTLLAEIGAIEEAVAEFRTAVELSPVDSELRMNLGVALRTIGESEEAVEHFRKVLATGEGEPGKNGLGSTTLAEVYHQMAQALQAYDVDESIAAYEQALAHNPEKLESYYGLGQTLKRKSARSRRRQGPPAADPGKAGEHLELGRAAAARGDVATAVQELRAAVAVAPSFAPAHDMLGFLVGQQGDLDSSVRHLRRAVELDPRSAETRYHLGLALWYRGEPQSATSELEEAAQLNPALAEACGLLGMAYRELGRYDDARRYLQRAIALSREQPAPYVDLGVLFLKEKRGDLALGQFEAALNIPVKRGPIPGLDVAINVLRSELATTPAHAVAQNVLGRLLGRSGADPERVIEAFREAIHLDPKYAEAHNNLGLVLTQTDLTDEAIAAFREAVRLRPDFADARANLGGVLVVVDADEAIEELKEALALNPGLVNAHYNLSRAYNHKSERGKEIEHLEQALRADPDFAKAHMSLGKALIAQRRIDDAVTHLERAIQLEPDLGEARYQLGLALVRVGRREEARRELEASRPLISERQQIETATLFMREAQQALSAGEVNQAVDRLRQVISLAPEYPEARLTLGEALSRRGDPEDAIAEYRRAVELKPDSYAGFLGMGRAMLSAGDSLQAVSAFRDAVRLRPSSAEAHRLLGESLLKSGSEEEALKAFREAVKLDPQDASAGEQIARIVARQQQQRRAELFSKLAESRPAGLGGLVIRPTDKDDPADIRDFESEIRTGNFSQVEPRLRRYVRANPESWWGYYALGYVLFAQQKIGESIAALAKSLRLNIENAEAHKILGRTLMIIGRYDRAQIEFEQAARLKPESAEIRYNLGKLYSAQDNFPSARREFDHALRLDPTYMEAYNALGFALESMNDNSAAVENYRKAIALNEERAAGFVSPYVNLAAHYNRLNQPSLALEQATEALSIDPGSDLALFQAAKAYQADKRWEEAVTSLERAISINARVSRYHYVLGLLYRRLGEANKSRVAFASFERLEREATELEAKRRETKRDSP